MKDYRLYAIIGGRTFAPPRIIEAEDDDDAIRQSRQYLDGLDLELWDGPRKVISLISER